MRCVEEIVIGLASSHWGVMQDCGLRSAGMRRDDTEAMRGQARQERGHAVWKERSNDHYRPAYWSIASADFS